MPRTAFHRRELNLNAAELAQLEAQLTERIVAGPALTTKIQETAGTEIFAQNLGTVITSIPGLATFFPFVHIERVKNLQESVEKANQAAQGAADAAKVAVNKVADVEAKVEQVLKLPETIDEQWVRYLLTGAILGTYLNQIYEPIRSLADLHSALGVLGIPPATVESVITHADRLWKSAALKEPTAAEKPTRAKDLGKPSSGA